MLITDTAALAQYGSTKRLWQGIPGIEITPGGRRFVTFYSGGSREEIGNCVVLLCAEKDGAFGEPCAVAAPAAGHRCFDPCLWCDPQGRLWLFWADVPDHVVRAVRCDAPDAPDLCWSEEMTIGWGVMMNKPTVLESGEWLLPLTLWGAHVVGPTPQHIVPQQYDGTAVWHSTDNGESFALLGVADVPQRWFDEHMLLEKRDGSLALYVRADCGICKSVSTDGGRSWSQGEDSGLGGPNSRFFIRRLRSGRVLLINHHNHTGRNNLTAFLSEDDGVTWPHRLLLDERDDVSYPDAVQAADGSIHIVYDRERGGFQKCEADALACAREVLTAVITEEDILAGALVSPQSRLKQIASKLTVYDGPALF